MFNLFKRKQLTTQQEWEVNYDALKRNIKDLVGTNGFNQMILWWEREYEALEVKIEQSTDPVEVYDLTRERKLVKKHYLFLKNLVEQ